MFYAFSDCRPEVSHHFRYIRNVKKKIYLIFVLNEYKRKLYSLDSANAFCNLEFSHFFIWRNIYFKTKTDYYLKSTKAYWAQGKKYFFRVITRMFRVITRIFRVITRMFRVITRIFRVITRMFRVITRIFRIITRIFRVIMRIFRVITRIFRVITRMFRVITRMFRVITRIFRDITRIFDILRVAVDCYRAERLLVLIFIGKDGKLNTSIYMYTVTLLSGTFKSFNQWNVSLYEHGVLTLLSLCKEY